MEFTMHEDFVDVLYEDYGASNEKILRNIRNNLSEQDVHITDDVPKRLGNSGIGTIYRFNLKLEE